jgi:hypothetical protein
LTPKSSASQVGVGECVCMCMCVCMRVCMYVGL